MALLSGNDLMRGGRPMGGSSPQGQQAPTQPTPSRAPHSDPKYNVDPGEQQQEPQSPFEILAEAAASVGFDADAAFQNNDLPGILGAAAKSDFGATDGGISLIEQAAEHFGVPSPYQGNEDPNAPNYAMPPTGGIGGY